MSIRTLPIVGLAGLLALSLGAATSAEADVSRYEVRADGMACPFCVRGLKKKLKALPGAKDVHVDLESGLAKFDVAAGNVLLPGLVEKAVRDAGFAPRALTVRASGSVRGSVDDLSLDVGNGLSLLLRGGRAIDELRALVREGRREVVITGTLTGTRDAWQLSVTEVRDRGEA